MHSSTNRSNHDFQIAYFIAGACHTPDAAYAILCDLHESRDNAIKMFEASKLRERAKRIRAERMLNSADEADQLDGKADIEEINAMSLTVEKNLVAAIAEREIIEKCMAKLEPLRKYKDLTLPEAHEACQREEWLLEFKERVENYLLTQGSIPPDQFSTMRLHPDFSTDILPHINHIQKTQMKLQSPEAKARELAIEELMKISTTRIFELPDLPLILKETTSCLNKNVVDFVDNNKE